MRNPFRYFNSSPEVIRLTVMMYIRYPLSLRQVEDLMSKRGIIICHETVRFHASLHNHFNQDRHLNRRDIFKQNRSAALAEWRLLAA
jgi:transposase-like protein